MGDDYPDHASQHQPHGALLFFKCQSSRQVVYGYGTLLENRSPDMDVWLKFESFTTELLGWGNWLLNGLNSNFPAALGGAAAGALGAHWIAAHAKRREEAIREIHETNAAIVLCGTICRSFLVYKQQHVRPLVDDYQNLKRDF